MAKFNTLSDDRHDHIFVAIEDRFDVARIRSEAGIELEVYPITDGEVWDDPVERFAVNESDVRTLEDEMADRQHPLLIPDGRRLMPGKLYLRLYHGRNEPDEELDDWGFDGPVFGPLDCVAQTYLAEFRLDGPDGVTDSVVLKTHGDLVVWGGKYYGDLAIFIAGQRDVA